MHLLFILSEEEAETRWNLCSGLQLNDLPPPAPAALQPDPLPTQSHVTACCPQRALWLRAPQNQQNIIFQTRFCPGLDLQQGEQQRCLKDKVSDEQ